MFIRITENCWEPKQVSSGWKLPETQILFQRIDKKVIEEESAKLQQISRLSGN